MRFKAINSSLKISKSRSLFALLIMLCLSMFFSGCKNSDKDSEQMTKATFDMALENSKGEQVNMEEFRGKKIFFNVWATWCPPCIEEMPTIHNLYEEIGDQEDVVFLMLTMDQDFQKAIEYREKYGYNFEIYRPTGPMPAKYHTKLIPTTFVINSEGYLVLQHDGVGEFDTAEFKEYFASVK